MRVLVCGGRDFNDYDLLSSWMIELFVKALLVPEDVTIISGHARGADKLGERFANDNNCELLVFPADWNKFGKGAGHIRNQQMIDEGKPDLVVAFPGGNGTQDMIRRAVKARVRTVSIHKYGDGYTEYNKDGC